MGLRWRRHWRGKGVYLAGHKAESLRGPIQQMPLPERLQVPMQQYGGESGEPLVAVGQQVAKGEVLAAAHGEWGVPVHAPTSGMVVAVGPMPIPHPSGHAVQCVVIAPDGRDAWVGRERHADFRALSPQAIGAIVRDKGVVGMGGALFPTAVKLAPQRVAVNTLVINAAECEPYITCDQALIAERAGEIVKGMEIVRHALGAARVLLGIEDNQVAAIAALERSLQQTGGEIALCVIPSRYPSGSERQLLQTLTGREVPARGLPADIGMRVINAATAGAVYRAVCLGEPLISRIVTVTGDGVVRPGNVEVLMGTPITALMRFCGGYRPTVTRLTMGGPMMGLALPNDELPVIQSTNCLIASSGPALVRQGVERACIRCGACAQVCPVNLLPQQLYWHAQARDLARLAEYHLADCIECGACAHVCPSHIPLVQHYRHAKSAIQEQARKRQEADKARRRHEVRQARLVAEQRDKDQRMADKRALLEASRKAGKTGAAAASVPVGDGAQDVIAAALLRVQAKKRAPAAGPPEGKGRAV